MRLPRIFRTTPFRLTLIFLALFAGSAAAFLAYIYLTTAGQVTRVADRAVQVFGGRGYMRRTWPSASSASCASSGSGKAPARSSASSSAASWTAVAPRPSSNQVECDVLSLQMGVARA